MFEGGSGEPDDWHRADRADVAAKLGCDVVCGLTSEEAQARLARFGGNRLAETPSKPAWLAFLEQFRSALILVLVGAAGLAGLIGNIGDACAILVVVVINACLGFWQEHRAAVTLAALKKMLAPVASVRRDGRAREIPAEDVVPGDVVLLEAGDRVPADGRLIAAHGAEVDETALTGESMPVAKDAAAIVAAGAPLAERLTMAYLNTVVTRGRMEMVVTATGMATETGRLSAMLAEIEPGPTPLQVELDRVGYRLAIIAGAVVAAIFALGVLKGDPLADTLLSAIALAVAAIPEGLPAVVTVTLAVGMHQMAKRHAIVRQLAAVETLGCTTVICTDKTGTLTLNQMTARAVAFAGRRFRVSGEGYNGNGAIEPEDGGPRADLAPLLVPAALACQGRIDNGALIGDPTEGALLALAAKGGADPDALSARWLRLAEVPFDSSHKFMATFHRDGAEVRIFVKGAPDVLLGLCGWVRDADGEAALDAAGRGRLRAENEEMAGAAMRVIGLAERSIPASEFDPGGDLKAYVTALTMAGLVGIVDPPRPEARAAIATCRRAGIAVKMITGDHRLTAAAVAGDLGLDGAVAEAHDLDAVDDDRLGELAETTAVFARAAPEHKMKIVQALKARGHVVAMTGDGVNDGPALRAADIGIAMGGSGTEVAKEAAAMVLADDNFATIVAAVRQGRATYDNIVKFVRFQLSTNIGAILTVLGASLLGAPSPFTPIQILWINIIMDGPPAMSLGVEPPRPGIMDAPPRDPASRILAARRLAVLAGYGLTMAVGTLGVYLHALPQGLEHAATLAFTTFVLFQGFNIFNARAEGMTAFNRHLWRNRYLWLSLVAMVALQALVVHWAPAQAIFRTTELTAGDWGLAVLVASSVLLLDEARKAVLRHLKPDGAHL